MVEIQMMQLDVDAAAVREADALLSPDEQWRARRFARARDCRRYTVARAALRRHLGSRLGVAPQAVEFAYGPHGKPCLAECHGAPDLRFNVSRCDDVAAIAFASGREVGVDIEAVREMPDAEAITGQLGSAIERRTWSALGSREKLRGFFNWWTRKEAFVKARGGGLSLSLHAFDVSFAPGAPARLLRIADSRGDESGWSLDAFEPGAGLVGAIAFAAGDVEAEKIDVHD